MNDTFEQARRHFLDGVAQHEAGHFAAAEAALLASLALLPGRPSTLMNLGAARLALGRPQEALADLQASLAAEPDQVQTLCHLGAAHQALGQPRQARDAYAQALARAPAGDPAQEVARYHLAVATVELQQPAQALEILEPLLRADEPEMAPAWLLAGQTLQILERHAEALPHYQQALALQPRLARAAVLLGQLLKNLGRPEQAQAVHEQALQNGVDEELNRYLLAGLRGEAAPPASPVAYVRGLFDPYAEDFEPHLVHTLRYQGHEAVVQAAQRASPGRSWAAVLDLGCGSGLCGRLVRPTAQRVSGVDLSPTMIAVAQRTGCYDTLHEADVVQHLQHTEDRFDLLLAADLFIYLGDLDAVMAGARRVLRHDGLFCLTIETLSADEPAPKGYHLRPSLRYAHDAARLSTLALGHGLQTVEQRPVVLREDQRQPVHGAVIALRG